MIFFQIGKRFRLDHLPTSRCQVGRVVFYQIGNTDITKVVSEVIDCENCRGCLWFPRVGMMAVEDTKAIGDADLGAKDEDGALLEHVGGVEDSL